MNRYVEFDIISVTSTGNVQEGYEPVLTLDAWKAQDNIKSTADRLVRRCELSIDIDPEESPTVGISAVRKLLSDMETHGVERLDVTAFVDRDERVVGPVVLYSESCECVPKTESDYLKEYRTYVFNLQRTNRDHWRAYVKDCQVRDEELSKLKELLVKYPDQAKTIIEGSVDGCI